MLGHRTTVRAHITTAARREKGRAHATSPPRVPGPPIQNIPPSLVSLTAYALLVSITLASPPPHLHPRLRLFLRRSHTATPHTHATATTDVCARSRQGAQAWKHTHTHCHADSDRRREGATRASDAALWEDVLHDGVLPDAAVAREEDPNRRRPVAHPYHSEMGRQRMPAARWAMARTGSS